MSTAASIANTAKGNLIVGVISHELNQNDSITLPEILGHVEIRSGKQLSKPYATAEMCNQRNSDHFAW